VLHRLAEAQVDAERQRGDELREAETRTIGLGHGLSVILATTERGRVVRRAAAAWRRSVVPAGPPV
jgi:hypothetical protein